MTSPIKVKKVPSTPGVYFFRNRLGETLYVGKAKNLRGRLSYYQNPKLVDGKTAEMLKAARSLGFLNTVSEADALVLEAELIKKERPLYNRTMKDDKSYQHLRVSQRLKGKSDPFDTAQGHPERSRMDEKFEPSAALFPAVNLVRKKENDGAEYFGPYPVGSAIRLVLKHLRKVYNFRDCSEAKFKRYQKTGRGCLYYDFHLCGAPCAGLIGVKDYRKNIRNLKKFMKLGGGTIEKGLEKEMRKASLALDFEKAQENKWKLRYLSLIRQVRFSPSDYLENPFLFQDIRAGELNDLIAFYNQNSAKPIIRKSEFRIEAYDVSHLSGRHKAASMVVFINATSDKKQYRRFKIKKTADANDYQMTKEVLERRAEHRDWPKADLILIDGGLGQTALAVSLVPETPVIGLAKRLERPVINGAYVVLKEGRPALNLLKRIRDEAHRFAKAYHLLLRSKL